jgi:rubredoxin
MAWHCKKCGHEMDAARTDRDTGNWRCPNCGAEPTLVSTEVPPPPPAATQDPTPIQQESAETVFQPGLMMESIMDELESEPSVSEPSSSDDPGTETLETDPNAVPAPYLQLDVEAYLLILGASPGKERRPLARAKTTFGRQASDVALEDPAISSSHFQIEAFGKEFFLRDLDSRNGTFLNGTRVRYSQLLPGDQITAGKTSLIFRTSDDLIDRV